MTMQMSKVGQTTLEHASYEPVLPQKSASLYRTVGKRLFDIAFVLAAAPVGLMLVAVGVVLALLSGVSPFFLQERVGRGGRIFKLVKIRTMAHNADALLEAHLAQNPEARREWDRKQKLENDPRITRFGTLLRRTSLDEMPQLWNVLTGDMSIVGPRPMMVEQQSLYPGKEYYLLRPGITGPWQISDRSQSSFAARAGHDRDYHSTLSLKQDLRILRKTVGAVLNCTGR